MKSKIIGDQSITMKIKANTRNRLADYGKKSETFDDIINRLLDIARGSE